MDIPAAARRIAGHVRRTPVLAVGDGTWFKCEFLQRTGSFKPRGLVNRVLAARESGELDPAVGIVAASGGNAGLAAAYAASRVGVPAEVWVPETAPAVKVARLRTLGATVVQHGEEYAQAYEGAVKRAADIGAVYCHAYDQPDVVAGQGTLGLELLDQIDAFDTVYVACGGGGLTAGIASALEGRARVVAVEPESCPTLHAALAAGGPVDVPVSGIAADSLGARRIGEIAYRTAVRCNISSVLVSDEAIVAARRTLWRDYRIVVEHGAAAALAGATGPGVVVLCGANTDPKDLAGS